MITYLNIRNFALIENSEIHFSENLNIITGETGAGKSMIIQALSILLGNRANMEQIRSGCSEALVNATIEINGNEAFIDILKEKGIVIEDNEIILRRQLLSTGKSRSYINGTPVTSKELALISSELFDFHGQHEGISLLKKKTHITYLDNFCKNDDILNIIKEKYNTMNDIQKSLKQLEENETDKEKKIELLKYEIEEIENSKFKENEDIELEKRIKILENAEQISAISSEISDLMHGEIGIVQKTNTLRHNLDKLSQLDDEFNPFYKESEDIYFRIEDMERELISKITNIDYNPNELDALIEKKNSIDKLKRKYGNSYKDIMKYYENAQKQLKTIEFSNEEKEKLKKKLRDIELSFIDECKKLSEKRKMIKKQVEAKVEENLKELNMSNVQFVIKITPLTSGSYKIKTSTGEINCSINGIDEIEFLISPNKGEPLKPLYKIASGGELSRIILAFKNVFAENDMIHTMIFDEIDSGIGGNVARSVASKMKKLAETKQIICITHLAQLAAVGDKNFIIEKHEEKNRTITHISAIQSEQKRNEIARMLSGNITETSLLHADELINSLR